MSRALQLREGIAPTRDRLTTTVFMAALVHGVIIVGVTFGSTSQQSAGAPGLEVLIVSEDVPEARRNDTATYLAQRTQLGSGATPSTPPRRVSPRGAAELAASQGRVDGTRLMDEAGALLATADGRVLTTSATDAGNPLFRPAGKSDGITRGSGAAPRATANGTSSASTTPRNRSFVARSATNCG